MPDFIICWCFVLLCIIGTVNAVDPPISVNGLLEEAVTHGITLQKLLATATIAKMAYSLYLFEANEAICMLPLVEGDALTEEDNA